MSLYYCDLFTGTAGTLLTSHTADSGATWPNDSSHVSSNNHTELDGNGMLFQSGTGPCINIPSVTLPSTFNFEVLFTFERLTSVADSVAGVLLATSGTMSSLTDHWEFIYREGSGWSFSHQEAPASIYVAGPAVGVTWWMKVTAATSGSNTIFTAYYATSSGGNWTILLSYTVANLTDQVAIGPFFDLTSATSTTGQHIGRLVVQDPSSTTATLSGPTSGCLGSESTAFTVTLDKAAGFGAIMVTPSSTGVSDTFQAMTSGGNVLNASEIDFGTEGGTVSSPAPTILWTFQPTDTTKGPWQLQCRDALFGTTHDSVLSLGYNTTLVPGTQGPIPTEPQWHMNFEQDYYVSGNSTYACEWYMEFVGPSDTTSWRPIAITINQATGAANVGSEIGASGDPNYGQFQITTNGSAVLTVTTSRVTYSVPAYYQSTMVQQVPSASNGAVYYAYQADIGADAALGPLNIGLGGIPSSSAEARRGLLYTGDSNNYRILCLNSCDGSSYGPVSAGTVSLSGAIGVNGSTPPARAADPGTATGTDAAVINSIVTILKNLGFCS